jgi:hypothetical protein
MLAYNLHKILDLVPEALPLVKAAHIDEEMPLGNRDSVVASALEMKYQELTGQSVNIFAIEKVAKAVRLYKAEDDVSDLTQRLVKAAHEKMVESLKNPKAEYFAKEASFEGDRSGTNDPVSLNEKATELLKEAQALGIEPSESVLRYAAQGLLSKEACIGSLAARYQATQDPTFVKLASAVNRLDTGSLKQETVADICKTVSNMDKEAGLFLRGFDFYRETLLTKEAAISGLPVNLCGKTVPYEKIARLGRANVSQYIGEDVAKAMDNGAGHAKVAFEALPKELQKLAVQLINQI